MTGRGLFVSQCDHGIDPRRTPRREIARQQGDGGQHWNNNHKRERINPR